MDQIQRKGQTRFFWKEKMDVKQRKARKDISKKEKNKDDKNNNKNNLTIWNRLGWVKENSLV